MKTVLKASALLPGRSVWLEDNGFAFKKLKLIKAKVLIVTQRYVYFFPFTRLPLASYNNGMTWRCWNDEPDIDTVSETEWTMA